MTRRPRFIPTLGAALAVCLARSSASAQPAPTTQPRPLDRILIAGQDEALWVTGGPSTNIRLFRRTTNEPFDLGRPAGRPLVRLTVVGSDAVGFTPDGSIYRYSPDIADPIPEIILPGSALPLDVAGSESGILALVASSALDTDEDEEGPPASDDSSRLTLERYDLRQWTRGPDLPNEVPATAGSVRVGVGPKDLPIVVWIGADRRLRWAYQASETTWSEPEPIAGDPASTIWLVRVGKNLTLIAVSGPSDIKLQAWRLLGDPERAGASAWRPGTLRFDKPLEPSTRIRGAAGFSQHVAILADHGLENISILFGRMDAKPTLEAVDVKSVIAEPTEVQTTQGLLTIVTFGLLLVVLSGLFVFRRDAMIKGVVLPPDCALATFTQRIIAWLIDFVPFLVAASYALDVRMLDGLVTLRDWAFGTEPEGIVADSKLLLWWGVGCFGHVLYMCIMELLTGRTVGKVVARIHVLSETGTRPTAMQIVGRNVTRLIELVPQFWVFVLLVALSRNQQRLGDIFARTYVARRLFLLPHGPDNSSTESKPDDSTHEDDRH